MNGNAYRTSLLLLIALAVCSAILPPVQGQQRCNPGHASYLARGFDAARSKIAPRLQRHYAGY